MPSAPRTALSSSDDGGDPVCSTALADRARALAEAAGDPLALGQALNPLGALATSAAKPGEALGHLARSLALAEARR